MPRHNPTIGMYIPGTGTGGPWRYVHSILRQIDLDEFDVLLFCDIVGDYAPRAGVRVVPLSSAGRAVSGVERPTAKQSSPKTAVARTLCRAAVPPAVRTWAGFGREANRLAAVFRRNPVDLLHTNYTGCEESAVAARWAGIPRVIGTFHVDSTYDLHGVRSTWPHRLLEIVGNQSLSYGIGVSDATSSDWIRRTHLPARRVRTIYNGIDAHAFRRHRSRAEARRVLGVPDDGTVLLGGVGRMDEAKGFGFLLQAVANLASRGHPVRLALAGTGAILSQLTSGARELGIVDRVHFLGQQADVQIALDALDVFVLPSLCEALPYALLEAMATGLPAVGTTVGGVPEVIREGETGFLLPPGRADRLALAIQRLLPSAVLRERLGRAGRARVQTCFTEAQMVKQTLSIYREVVHSSAEPARSERSIAA